MSEIRSGEPFMSNIKDPNDILSISPLKKYTSPKYPTSAESRSNPALLKKLPSRWQKSAKVLACIGLVGTIALVSGCNADDYYIWTNENYEELIVRPHLGGRGISIYIAHLTEQEALSIIRAEAEAAGLRFDATPPNTIADVTYWGLRVLLDLYDEEKGVALAYINSDSIHHYPRSMVGFIHNDVVEEFSKHHRDITIGVFHQMVASVGSRHQQPNIEDKEKARKLVKEHLTTQVRDFIELLREQGIIE